MIDLRSDTVTRPTAAMREAMARAPVGDDVYGEDTTVNTLEARVAALLGKEAGLFVPSGTMGNQLALVVHCRRGDEVIVGEGAHNKDFESGAGAAIAGVQFAVAGRGGLFTGVDVVAELRADAYQFPPTRLVCVEDTHNRAGGAIWPRAQIADVVAAARARGLALHLDGARIWNAHVATGEPLAERAAGFDSVSCCLSKGLGAPVGSVLCGSRDFIREARRWRKRLGGGMRQAGILAAAGLYALDHHLARLVDDHASARVFADGFAGSTALRASRPETNIVMVDLVGAALDATALALQAKRHGVLVNAVGPTRLRAVTHLDVSEAECRRAAAILVDLAEGRLD